MANDISPSDLSDSERSDGMKKSTIAQLEHTQTHDDHVSFDTKATKRLLRKMDIRLIPFLALLYLLSFLDRYVSSPLTVSVIAAVEALLDHANANSCLAPILATPAWLVLRTI
jgi:hypothetical protein